MDIGTIVALIIAGVSAAATVVLAFLTYQTIKAYEQQVKIGQDQVKASQDQVRVGQEQQYNQFRPVLYPPEDLGDLVDRTGKYYIKSGLQNHVIDGLKNIGAGPAFNIYGILFGRPYHRW